ncbi:hypothetical protein Aduo_019971 [Ancylostoma duodenale]
MIPLFCLLIGVVCLLPVSLENRHDQQVLEGCPETNNIAYSDWGYRAFLYAIVVKTAGYGFELGYSCTREAEAAEMITGDYRVPPSGSRYLDYDDSEHRSKYTFLKGYDDYSFLLKAGMKMGEELKTLSPRTSIGCSYEKNEKRAFCFTL